jgi:hypothetical protein
MTLEGWNPLVLAPVVLFAAFVVLAVRAALRARKRKHVD